MTLNTESKRLIIIFFIALSLRLVLFLAVGSWNDEVLKERIFNPDAKGYHNIAINLLENNAFSSKESPPYIPNIFRTPIHPFFIASVYTLFGYKPYIAIFFQLIIGSITCILTYKIGKTAFNEKIAFLASLLMALEYSSILYSNMLLTETLFTFLFITHIYFLIKFIKENNNKMLVYSSVLLGISTLCRPISIYFFIFLIPVFFLHFRKSLRKGTLRYAILTLIFFLTVTPWMVRNYQVSGKFMVSSAQEKALRWYLPYLIKNRQKLKEAQSRQMERVKNTNSDRLKTRSENQRISNNIINVMSTDAKRYLKGMAYFFMATSKSPYCLLLGFPYNTENVDKRKGFLDMVKIKLHTRSIQEQFLLYSIIGYLFFIYFTMCCGIYMSIRKEGFLAIVLFLSILAYFVIATGAIGHDGRYRAPIMPYIILLASYGIIQIQERRRKYKVEFKNMS